MITRSHLALCVHKALEFPCGPECMGLAPPWLAKETRSMQKSKTKNVQAVFQRRPVHGLLVCWFVVVLVFFEGEDGQCVVVVFVVVVAFAAAFVVGFSRVRCLCDSSSCRRREFWDGRAGDHRPWRDQGTACSVHVCP